MNQSRGQIETLRFYSNCVGWPRDDVSTPGGLSDMIDQGVSITRRTFLQHVDRDDLAKLETSLGYALRGSVELTMARDWAVSYHRSALHGKRVYYFCHSAIEYVFTEGGEP